MLFIETFKILLAFNIIFCSGFRIYYSSLYCDKNLNKIKAFPSILNGRTLKENTHRYMVGLRTISAGERIGPIYCGGTIVRLGHVLTAAHCVNNRQKSSIAVCVNCFYSHINFYLFFVKDIFTHHEYNESTLEHDLAIIVLHQSVLSTPLNISSICVVLGESKGFVGDGLLVGWGALDLEGNNYPTDLKEGTVPCTSELYKQRELQFSLSGIIYDSKKMICCDGSYHGVGYADSGGPLIVSSRGILVQIGVVSSVIHFQNTSVSFIMNIAAYSSWFKQIIEGNEQVGNKSNRLTCRKRKYCI